MAAFFRTILTLVAGAGLTAGGFVAAAMSPELREAIGGLTAQASTPPSLDSLSDHATNEFGVSDMQALAASRENSVADWSLGQAADSKATAPASDAFLGNADASFGEMESGKSPAFEGLALPTDFGFSPPQTPTSNQSTPASKSPQPSNWHLAARALSTAGVTNFSISPTLDAARLRCDCWINDGQARRQLSGEGTTPAEAAVAAIEAVNDYRSSSTWFSSGASQ